jgi:hypothetical protein
MKLFKCQACGQLLYFDNRLCEQCGRRLGYLPEKGALSALEGSRDAWRALAEHEPLYRYCANGKHDVCNWLVPDDRPEQYCLACRHNGTVPDLSDPRHLLAWRKIENAKHRLFYSLLKFNLPLSTRNEDPEHGLIFHFLADSPDDSTKIMTGHDNGLITIALAEADDAERERRRTSMGEPYRTLLGHFRHEVGHHYWDILVRDGGKLDAFRALFGDDRIDYGEALSRHYSEGAPSNWRESFISSYATSHPWEDFAETWAHYLHIIDTLEMAGAFGLRLHKDIDSKGSLEALPGIDPYEMAGVQELVDAWLPLTFALSSLNQAMGHSDPYPFILTAGTIRKLGFVHGLLQEQRHEADRTSGACSDAAPAE